MTTTLPSPTQRWLATVPELPALTGPASTAERLLLLVHYGIDWQNSWLATRRQTYWTAILPDRVLAATYRAPNLRAWWTTLHHALITAPRSPAERRELDSLLGEDPRPVLRTIRNESDALLLRVRIIADAVRDTRPAREDAS